LILLASNSYAQSAPKPELPFNVLINEAGEKMEIEWDACLENSRLFIMDGNNRVLNGTNLCESNTELNFKDLEPGVYTIRIEHYTAIGEKRIVKTLENNLSRLELQTAKSNLDFTLFPNPAQSNISIGANECLENSILSIQDIQGRTLRSLKLCKDGYDVDVSDLPKGMYFIRIEHYTGVGVQRLVKD
jgi:hypothetical protein